MSWFVSLLIALATETLKVMIQQRQAAHDAHEVGRLQAAKEGLLNAKQALEWKVGAVADPRGAAALRVRDGAGHFVASDHDPDADHLP